MDVWIFDFGVSMECGNEEEVNVGVAGELIYTVNESCNSIVAILMYVLRADMRSWMADECVRAVRASRIQMRAMASQAQLEGWR
jgi:hypothetical protein